MVRPGEVRGAAAAVPPSESAFTLDVGSAMFKSAASKSRGTDGEASADDTAGPADVANMKDLEEFEGWTLPAEDGADDGGPPNAVPSYAGNFTTPVWSLSSMRFRHAIRDGGERAERLFDEMLRGAEKKIADAERRAEAAESLANERQLNASLNGASDPSPSRGPHAEGPPEGKPKNANRVPNAFSRGHPGAVDHDNERSLETGSGGGSPRVRLPPLEFPPTLATQSGGSLPGEATAPLAPASGRPLSARDHERIDGGDESTDGRRMDDRTDRRAAAESSTRSSAVSAPVRSRPESPGTKRPETPGDADDVDVVNIGGAAFGFRRPAWSLTSMAARHRRVNRGAVSRVENSTPAGDRDGDGDGDEKSAPGDGGGGRRGGVTRGAFEPRRPGGDDEEPERDGMEDDEVPEGVYDAPAAPRDSAWSLAAGVTGVTSSLTRIPPPPPPLEFGARGWDAGKTGGFTRPQWAGAAAAARRAAEGARGGLYAGGGGATRETMNAPPLGPSGALPVAVTPRDGSDERPAPGSRHRHAATTTALRDRVGGATTAAPRFGAPAGRSSDGVSGGEAVGSTSRFVG